MKNLTYNTKGEVISMQNPTQSVLNTAYTYDGIGNRKTASFGGSNYSYTTNNLNQYSAFSVSSAVKAPTYDLDGNMTFDGAQTYVYDAENRLVKVIKNVGNEVRYTYDVFGRRIKREVVAGGSVAETTDYVYDGWNLLAESGGQTKHYLWGLDLSGSGHGAGGVGGLLAEVQANAANPIYRYFTYDGNGNTSEVLDATGSMIAHYDYDAFGNTIKTAGSHATANSWRFSTKPLDPETGLYYYGYRFYSPAIGRWLNRDPIAERGGLNLYGFVGNDGVNKIDIFGMLSANIDNKGWSYAGYEKVIYKSKPVFGITIPDLNISGFCKCDKETGKYRPEYIATLSIETLIRDEDHKSWGNDDARSSISDPHVADGWRHSYQWLRRASVRDHEEEHVKHAEANFNLLKKILKESEKADSFDSHEACVKATREYAQEVFDEFYKKNNADADKIEKGEYKRDTLWWLL